jgi:chaperone required for assembly of F1-ATPase
VTHYWIFMRQQQSALLKRFYKLAGFEQDGPAFKLTLDGRPIKTPNQHLFKVPSRPLATMIAQ